MYTGRLVETGTADQFQFVYRTASGDVDIRARVGSVEAVQAWSKAGVMVRESLAANAAMGMMFISASSGSAFHQRLTTGAARTSTTGTAVAEFDEIATAAGLGAAIPAVMAYNFFVNRSKRWATEMDGFMLELLNVLARPTPHKAVTR